MQRAIFVSLNKSSLSCSQRAGERGSSIGQRQTHTAAVGRIVVKHRRRIARSVCEGVAGDWTATFHFTLLPLVICTPILLAFAVLIPVCCFKNIEKQSIVERLRAVD